MYLSETEFTDSMSSVAGCQIKGFYYPGTTPEKNRLACSEHIDYNALTILPDELHTSNIVQTVSCLTLIHEIESKLSIFKLKSTPCLNQVPNPCVKISCQVSCL